MAAAALLGFYGIAIFSIILLGHMCGLTSLGIPYMTMMSTFVPEDRRTTLFGIPLMTNAAKPQLSDQPSSKEASGDEAPSSASSPANPLNESGCP